VAATHLSFRRAEGPEQLEAVLEALQRRPLPRLLLGDLNLAPAVVEPMLTAAGYQLAPTAETFPADAPRTRIDYVAVAGGEVSTTEAPWTPVSDHRPVVADIEVE
jgi:endonuclease/exonuclease/phosphatase family metal-dependent hydrolase